jgi:hypothetical protein
VLRAPSILPDDEAEKDTGSVGQPTNSSLEAMIIQEEKDELLAAARKLPSDSVVQLPSVDVPAYVRDDKAVSANTTNTANPSATDPAAANGNAASPAVKPIDNSVKTLQITQDFRIQRSQGRPHVASRMTRPLSTLVSKFGDAPQVLKAGERIKIPVLVEASSLFRSGTCRLEVRPVEILRSARSRWATFLEHRVRGRS